MAATIVRNGDSVTSVAGETELYLNNTASDNPGKTLVTIEMVSGSCQFSAGVDIDSGFAIYSSAGDKILKTVANVRQGSLRVKGVGVFRISW